WSIGVASLTSQQVTVADSGGGTYTTTLYSYDWGGKVVITVSGVTGGVAATGNLLLPVDADGDDLPDSYERAGTTLLCNDPGGNRSCNADKTGTNVLDPQNPDK